MGYNFQTKYTKSKKEHLLKKNTQRKYYIQILGLKLSMILSVCINKFVRFYNLERKHTGLVKELKLKTPIDAIKY